ncbi:MAG: hypothetical protein LBR90_02550, partial [Elusimicrobiota bacterium]|nr:hypothetical protein [Elusimicrobiota bacterium]
MAQEENNNNIPDLTEFLNSLQNDASAGAGQAGQTSSQGEEFPFGDTFDIDAFVQQNNNTLEKTSTSIDAPGAAARRPAAGFGANGPALDNFNIDFASDEKEESIKNLEEKIAELETRFEDANKESAFAAAFPAESLPPSAPREAYPSNPTANEEFFSNISTTIETLKGSLENIVNARLKHEEKILKQDQDLIGRLRDKTTRLKSINMALSSEVKRAKNEKIEALRRSAEQTKELLSLRMQLNKVEEKARHGDFKLFNLAQQLSILGSQKLSLDEEITKIREDKLNSLRKTAEQTKEIMTLRFELAKTEEKQKQQQMHNTHLEEQLSGLREQRNALDGELYATRASREEAERKTGALEREIENLKSGAERSAAQMQQEAAAAAALREKLLTIETDLQRIISEKAAAMLKADNALGELEALRRDYEQKINALKTAQAQELELLKNQKAKETQEVTLELRMAEDKYRQEEVFVNTLKLQIDSLRKDITSLNEERAQLKGAGGALAREIESIKESHESEVKNLQRELQSAQEKLLKGEETYNLLSSQFTQLQKERGELSQEINQLLSAKSDALRQNDEYLRQINQIKEEHNAALSALRGDLQRLQAKNEQDAAAAETRAHNLLRENEGAVNLLKGEILALAGQKTLIDSELKKANTERYEILKQLEQNNKELSQWRQKYEQEINALREEKSKEAASYEEKLSLAQERALQEQAAAAELKTQITALETAAAQTQKTRNAQSEADSKKIAGLGLEIVTLKTQLAAAESRFQQDTVLIQQLKERVTIAQNNTGALDNELESLKAIAAAAKADLAEKEAQMAALKETLSKTQEQLEEQERANAQLKEHTSKLKAVNSALDREVKKVQAEKMDALNKSAEQAKEILMLKEQLTKAESGLHSLNFEGGIVSLRKEYEAKVESLETQLKDVSARFAEQVKEIQNLKTDNSSLKAAQEEQINAQAQHSALNGKITALESQINAYKQKEGQKAAIAASVGALTAQVVKAKREKAAMEDKLAQMQQTIDDLTKGGRQTAQALSSIKEQISGNDALIENLKREIVVLSAENKQLKESADMQAKRERALNDKINEVESDNEKLNTTMRLRQARPAAAPK